MNFIRQSYCPSGTKELDEAYYVCTNATCLSIYNIGAITKTFYPQICCPECGSW